MIKNNELEWLTEDINLKLDDTFINNIDNQLELSYIYLLALDDSLSYLTNEYIRLSIIKDNNLHLHLSKEQFYRLIDPNLVYQNRKIIPSMESITGSQELLSSLSNVFEFIVNAIKKVLSVIFNLFKTIFKFLFGNLFSSKTVEAKSSQAKAKSIQSILAYKKKIIEQLDKLVEISKNENIRLEKIIDKYKDKYENITKLTKLQYENEIKKIEPSNYFKVEFPKQELTLDKFYPFEEFKTNLSNFYNKIISTESKTNIKEAFESIILTYLTNNIPSKYYNFEMKDYFSTIKCIPPLDTIFGGDIDHAYIIFFSHLNVLLDSFTNMMNKNGMDKYVNIIMGTNDKSFKKALDDIKSYIDEHSKDNTLDSNVINEKIENIVKNITSDSSEVPYNPKSLYIEYINDLAENCPHKIPGVIELFKMLININNKNDHNLPTMIFDPKFNVLFNRIENGDYKKYNDKPFNRISKLVLNYISAIITKDPSKTMLINKSQSINYILSLIQQELEYNLSSDSTFLNELKKHYAQTIKDVNKLHKSSFDFRDKYVKIFKDFEKSISDFLNSLEKINNINIDNLLIIKSYITDSISKLFTLLPIRLTKAQSFKKNLLLTDFVLTIEFYDFLLRKLVFKGISDFLDIVIKEES